jgi:hypothetical protein
MEVVLHEIEYALEREMFYLAIVMSLTLPDICAALGSKNGKSSGDKYKEWYRDNLAHKYPNLTDGDCWNLRCGVVHQGRCGHPDMQYARVIFTVPNAQNNVFHNNILNDALNLDAIRFCRDIIQSVRDWYEISKDADAVQANVPHMVRYRPNGIAPYMVGMPVIA